MKSPSILTTTLIVLSIFSWSRASSSANNFLECLSKNFTNYSSISNNILTPINSSYSSTLIFSIQNLRYASDSTPKPQVIITPEHESEIPMVIYCARETGMQVRTRSGGHDFEGLSYRAKVPFVLIDLINLAEIKVDVAKKSAWVGAGATLGSLYYRIAEKSPVLGFPAGNCSTVGVGGQFSGGGVGFLVRKYGLAADNIINARIVDVDGRILDRKSMGEDLFWAIRGSGGTSYGVILSWRVRLVDVPEKVTVFTVDRTLEQNATQLLHRWQYVAPQLNKDILIGVVITRQNSTINASFYSLFLGGMDRLLTMMQESFPELGLMRKDCTEMSWIESIVYPNPTKTSPQLLLMNRTNPLKGYMKGKSDYVQTPIPKRGLEGLWRRLQEEQGQRARIQLVPYGGRMAEISDSAIPFPHRAGNLFEVWYLVSWREEENRDLEKYVSWIRRLESYLTPYVSRNPRRAYVNIRDLDLGVNDVEGKKSHARASVWGKRYFNTNFNRLVRVKTAVDPRNFFRNEQSIPPLQSRRS